MQQLLSCINSCLSTHVTEAISPGSAPQLQHSNSSEGYHNAVALDELQLLTLNVTPLGTSMGLVQWVPQSTTLFDVFKGWQARLLDRYASHGAAAVASQAAPRNDAPAEVTEAAAGYSDGVGRSARGRGRVSRGRGRGRGRTPLSVTTAQAPRNPCSADTAAAHERALEQATKVMLDLGGPQFPLLAQDITEPKAKGPVAQNGTGAGAPDATHASVAAAKLGSIAAGRAGERRNGAANAPDAVAMKPSELFYSVLQHELRQADLAPQLPRKEWPAAVLLKVHSQLLRKVPAQLLAQELSASAHDAVQWWGMHRRYTSSLALSSIASYLLGIGDRHLNNILLVQGSGQIVHVDSSVCFDQGTSLRVPEVVPFRLTQMLVAALGPLGAQVWQFQLKPGLMLPGTKHLAVEKCDVYAMLLSVMPDHLCHQQCSAVSSIIVSSASAWVVQVGQLPESRAVKGQRMDMSGLCRVHSHLMLPLRLLPHAPAALPSRRCWTLWSSIRVSTGLQQSVLRPLTSAWTPPWHSGCGLLICRSSSLCCCSEL